MRGPIQPYAPCHRIAPQDEEKFITTLLEHDMGILMEESSLPRGSDGKFLSGAGSSSTIQKGGYALFLTVGRKTLPKKLYSDPIYPVDLL